MGPVISAENLSKRYGSLLAVDTISFSVRRGEVFGFLGPNGAGKTTTMKMIQCISPKTSGLLTVFDMDVDTHPREIKRMLGVLPQETNLDPDFTCYENLTNYARYFEIAEKRGRRPRGQTPLFSPARRETGCQDRETLRRHEATASPRKSPYQRSAAPHPR